MNRKVRSLCQGAAIAALYVVFTFVSELFGLAGGSSPIQFRFSEALCVLACFTPAAIPGLAIGCLLANLLSGAIIWDVLFGSLATFLGAIGTWVLRKNRYLAVLPPIIANTVIVPFVLRYAYGFVGAISYFMLTVGIGEITMCGVCGLLLYLPLSHHHSRMGL